MPPKATPWESMEFAEIPAGSYRLGLDWQARSGDKLLGEKAVAALGVFAEPSNIATWFSPVRNIALPGFAIARDTISAEELLDESGEHPDDYLASMNALCAALDRALGDRGLRLPIEDELEAACGSGIFYWGNTMPDGIPYGSDTSFADHKKPSPLGLSFSGDPYRVEIANGVFKLGDGGTAICGGYPWPVAWLALSSSYRLSAEAVADALPEFLEDAQVRPVRVGKKSS